MKINWLKILLFVLLAVVVIGLGTYITYVIQSYTQMENFSKRQISGSMAMYMPMFVFAQLLTIPFMFAMYYYLYRGGGIGGIKKNRFER